MFFFTGSTSSPLFFILAPSLLVALPPWHHWCCPILVGVWQIILVCRGLDKQARKKEGG